MIRQIERYRMIRQIEDTELCIKLKEDSKVENDKQRERYRLIDRYNIMKNIKKCL